MTGEMFQPVLTNVFQHVLTSAIRREQATQRTALPILGEERDHQKQNSPLFSWKGPGHRAQLKKTGTKRTLY